jgi:hypothetical protein
MPIVGTGVRGTGVVVRTIGVGVAVGVVGAHAVNIRNSRKTAELRRQINRLVKTMRCSKHLQ